MTRSAIEVRLKTVDQLVNSMDPSPFLEKDLDPRASSFIEEWAEELPRDAELALVIHLPQATGDRSAESDVAAAVQRYFGYSRDLEWRRFHARLRYGRQSLAIGLLFLAACTLLSEGVSAVADGPLATLLEQGLLIIGWVANWRPVEIFLYDWWPIRRKAQLYARLSAMPVEIRYDGA